MRPRRHYFARTARAEIRHAKVRHEHWIGGIDEDAAVPWRQTG
jgi:hypothetical protein